MIVLFSVFVPVSRYEIGCLDSKAQNKNKTSLLPSSKNKKVKRGDCAVICPGGEGPDILFLDSLFRVSSDFAHLMNRLNVTIRRVNADFEKLSTSPHAWEKRTLTPKEEWMTCGVWHWRNADYDRWFLKLMKMDYEKLTRRIGCVGGFKKFDRFKNGTFKDAYSLWWMEEWMIYEWMNES